ncbi:F0F1 ATP synthase subunit A [Pseudolysinimonas yzui]|uniref:ATP synthase subunit a n=1 Tax=Pseudolysinimonas yzui TaxID=2708254 RepID=A0A8J3GNF8_9MICO|nr:F0F1 ATP synthase subunit A [Pseudolysinimonas yzui]GHF07147.1 ATP synthase subunit a [Pseudolysinimonas yzui]
MEEFFPEPILFLNTPFEMNRILLIRMLVVVVLAVIFWVATRNLKVVPTKGQVVFETITGFVRNNIIIETLGEKDGRRFMPVLFTIFFLTLGLNITGVIPGLQIASTGLIGQALIMALVAYFTFIYAGMRRHGFRFFKNQTVLPGVPIFIVPVIAILEALSTFIIRPVTLTLRLTMNMVAGHMLLVLCFLATNFFFVTVLVEQGNPLGLLGVGTFAFGIAFTALEIFVAALQAFVFTILTAIYIQLALADEH